MIFYLFSFLIVAFGQAAWASHLGALAASFGYALFWYAILKLPTRKERFFHSFFWFFGVQLVQLSWLASVDYMGPFIFFVYFLMAAFIGLQFGLLGAAFDKERFCFCDCLLLSGFWVLLEWSRLFICTGFPWNPVGLSLADSNYAIQFASVFGVYGLSFWVIFVNAFGVYLLQVYLNRPRLNFAWGAFSWSFLALFPYLFGFIQEQLVLNKIPIERTYSVALVQTGILPEQKDFFIKRKEEFIPPLSQWERIWSELDPNFSCDLIVLPEAAIALGARRAGFSLEAVKDSWRVFFGEKSLRSFPPLKAPYAKMDIRNGKVSWKVTNAFIAQALANHFQADVIAGFDDEENLEKYNAVFHFQPANVPFERYEKRVLVPIGEYMPLSWVEWLSRFLAKEFGIGDSFNVGGDPKLFNMAMPTGVSVCVEETYSHLIRDLRLMGARLFVNVTNDVWFPRSRLPLQHFQHGRIRSAENGVYSLRSCNTGVTGVVDCFGRIVQTVPVCEENVNILHCTFPIRSFQTLYTWWGDSAILLVSCLFVCFGAYRRMISST